MAGMVTLSTSPVTTFRRRLLRVHGTILTLVAMAAAVATTIALITGAGPFGFMHEVPWAWVGLFQAYLLMAIIAVLLIVHAPSGDRKWDVVGALAHVPPLVVALSSLPLFEAQIALVGAVAAITFHTVFLVVEAVAALLPNPPAPSV
jgi:hypothetical protein